MTAAATPTAPSDAPAAPTPGARARARILTLVKLVVAVGLLSWLVAKNDIDPQKIVGTLKQPRALLLPILIGAVGISMSALRWRILLRGEGIDCSVGLALRLTWIGHFWNMVTPGAVSGDAVKMYYVGKAFPEKREEAWTTVFSDRLIGMAALVAVSTVATLVNLDFMLSRPELKGTAAVMLGVLLAMAGGFAVLSLGIGRSTGVADHLRKRLPAVEGLRRAYHTLLRLGERPGMVLGAFTISFVAHGMAVFTAFTLGQAVGDQALSFGKYLVLFPVALFVNAVPLTPGGLGVGESVLKNLFTWSGGVGSDGTTIMVLYRLNFYLLAVVGALLYVLQRRDATPKAPAAGGAAQDWTAEAARAGKGADGLPAASVPGPTAPPPSQ